MAKNTGNKRIAVKHVRDRAKSAYEKKDHCAICGTKEDLELHHTHSITLLLNSWAARKGYDISTDEGILGVRDEFIQEHHREIYEEVYTLCNRHHVALHSVYGKTPSPGSEARQGSWIEKQRAKHQGGSRELVAHILAPFSAFYSEVIGGEPADSFARFYKGIAWNGIILLPGLVQTERN